MANQPTFTGDLPIAERLRERVASALANPRVAELALYVLVSGTTAAFDLAIFTALVFTSYVSSPVAGALSYLIAMIAHYWLSVTFVFRRDLTGKSNGRLLGEYLASGLVGVVLTALVIWLISTVLGLSPFIGKIAGVGVSFIAVYSLRTFVIFKPRAAVGSSEAGSETVGGAA